MTVTSLEEKAKTMSRPLLQKCVAALQIEGVKTNCFQFQVGGFVCRPSCFFSGKKLLLFVPPICPFHRNACSRHQEADKKDILAKRASAGAFLLHHLGVRPTENSILVLLLCSPGGTEEVLLLLAGSSKQDHRHYCMVIFSRKGNDLLGRLSSVSFLLCLLKAKQM